MKSTLAIGLLLLIAFGMSVDWNPTLRTGAAWCNVTARPHHDCQSRWNALPGAVCNAPPMITTIAQWGEWANWIETPTTDNCQNYTDQFGWWCENYANEPSDLNCLVHVWGWIY